MHPMSLDRVHVLNRSHFNLISYLSQWIRDSTAAIYAPRRHPIHPPSMPEAAAAPITVVCISDTLYEQPDLPPGDILLHAGDLTENGTFEELQAQLTWLSSQPHTYKIMVAGERDALLDPPFTAQHPDLYPMQEGRTVADLNFGAVIYLRDSSVTIQFPEHGSGREVAVYGCPTISSDIPSAFRVPRDVDVWTGTVPDGTDIILSHSPPWNCLDGDQRRGSPFLSKEIKRVKPRLAVFGHEFTGYGEEQIDLSPPSSATSGDGADTNNNNDGGGGSGVFISMLQMPFRAVWRQVSRWEIISRFFNAGPVPSPREKWATGFINASLYNGVDNEESKRVPVVTYI